VSLVNNQTVHHMRCSALQAAETANAELALRLAQQQEIDAEKTTQLAADQQMIEARLLCISCNRDVSTSEQAKFRA